MDEKIKRKNTFKESKFGTKAMNSARSGWSLNNETYTNVSRI